MLSYCLPTNWWVGGREGDDERFWFVFQHHIERAVRIKWRSLFSYIMYLTRSGFCVHGAKIGVGNDVDNTRIKGNHHNHFRLIDFP